MRTEVTIRSGRPAALAMCQPSLAPALPGLSPPTFVARPRPKGVPCVIVSQKPQKPTYAASSAALESVRWVKAPVSAYWPVALKFTTRTTYLPGAGLGRLTDSVEDDEAERPTSVS